MAREQENNQGEKRETYILLFLRHEWLHSNEEVYLKIVLLPGKPLLLFCIGRLSLWIDL